MAGNISKTKMVAATAQQSGNTIYVTYQGGQDNQDVQSVHGVATVNNADHSMGTVTGVGQTMSVGGSTGKDHVVVTAVFKDGSTQVITDTYV